MFTYQITWATVSVLLFVFAISIAAWLFALWVADVGIKVPSDCGEIPPATFHRRPRGEPADVDQSCLSTLHRSCWELNSISAHSGWKGWKCFTVVCAVRPKVSLQIVLQLTTCCSIYINRRSVLLNREWTLFFMNGPRQSTDNLIEVIGIKRSRILSVTADIIIRLTDASAWRRVGVVLAVAEQRKDQKQQPCMLRIEFPANNTSLIK